MRPIGRARHPSYGSSFAESRSTAAMKLARASAKQSPRRLEHVTPQEEGRERESAGNIVRRRRIGTRVGKKRRTDFLEGDTAPPDNQVQQIELLGKLMLYDKEL
jgi:hypothetical protein